MRNTKLLLEALTKEMPPKEGQHHNITLDNDKLRVALMLPKGCMSFYLKDDDMDTSMGDLIDEIRQITLNLGR